MEINCHNELVSRTMWVPLSLGFFRQEYWSGMPFVSPRGLPNLVVEPGSPELQANSLPTEQQGQMLISSISASNVHNANIKQKFYLIQ